VLRCFGVSALSAAVVIAGLSAPAFASPARASAGYTYHALNTASAAQTATSLAAGERPTLAEPAGIDTRGLRSGATVAQAASVTADRTSATTAKFTAARMVSAQTMGTGAAGSAYQPVSPQLFYPDTNIPADSSTTVYPLGEGGFPTTGPGGAAITALAIDMTAKSTTTAFGDLNLYPDSATRPITSDVQFNSSLASTDTVVVAPGATDQGVTVYNNSTAATTVGLTSDGYYYTQAAGAAGYFPEQNGAIRILDTRKGSEPQAGQQFSIQVTGNPACSGSCVGNAGVPTSATAVAVNITAVGQTATTSIKAWATGTSQPVAVEEANPDGAVADFDQVALGSGSYAGQLTLMTDLYAANILVDVEGYYTTGSGGTLYVPITPTRVVDSRSNTGTVPITGSTPQTFQIAGADGVPATAVAVIAVITVVNPATGGYLTAGPTSGASSVMDFPKGTDVANTDDLTLSSAGAAIFGVSWSASGSTQLQYLVDILGYYDAPSPVVVKTVLNTPAGGYFTNGQAVRYQIAVTNPGTRPLTVSLSDALPAGLMSDPNVLSSLAPNIDICPLGATCSMAGNGLTVTNVTVPAAPVGNAAPTNVVDVLFAVILNVAAPGCSIVTDTPQNELVATYGAGEQVIAPVVAISVCDSDLGIEPWFTYDATPVADGSTGQVNAANGNLVVTQTDGVPVSDHGHLGLNIRRSYNSQDSTVLTTPGSLGDGWALNIGQTDALAGSGVVPTGLLTPSLSGIVNAVTDPLSVTLVDRDGNREVFTPSSVGAAVDVSTLTTALSSLKPTMLVSNPTSGGTICLDQTFTPPPGIHIGLWRYVYVAGAPGSAGACSATSLATSSSVTAGYISIRPDRLREEYNALGQLLSMTDQAGVTLKYAYYSLAAPVQAQSALAAVYESTQTALGGGACAPTIDNTNATATVVTGCRGVALNYPSATSEKVTDPSGQVTTYTFHTASYNPLVKLLDTVTNPGSNGTVTYTYQGDGSHACGGQLGQLCTITDERGHTTTFGYDYTAGQLGGGRVIKVTDRRGYAHTFGYLSNDPSFGNAMEVTALGTGITSSGNNYTDPSTPSREIIYGQIDASGRVGVTLSGAPGITYNPSTYATNALTETREVWDGDTVYYPNGFNCRVVNPTQDNDVCQVTVMGSGTTPDAVTTSTYDDAGMLLTRSVSAARGDGGSTRASTLITTYGYDRQYATASGVTPSTERVNGGGAVVLSVNGAAAVALPSSAAPGSGVLYTLADKTQQLDPCGNAAGSTATDCGSESDTADLTTWVVDDNAGAAPNLSAAGACSGSKGNSGLICQQQVPYGQDRRTSGNTASTATTSDTYNADGSKASMTTPNGGVYTYAYYTDSQTDSTGHVNAGGWLLGVADPLTGATPANGGALAATTRFVAFNYDTYGHVDRTWDRNATSAAGLTLASYATPGSANLAAPNAVTLYSNTSTPGVTPWRWLYTSTDPDGHTTTTSDDASGDTVAITSPNGASTASTPATYDPDGDLLTSTSFTGDEAQYSYTAFDQAATEVSPNASAAGATPVTSITASSTYDAVGRLTALATLRGTAASPNCATPGGMFPSGQYVCTATTGYDSESNPVQTTDANGQLSSTVYDADHRVLSTSSPAYDSTGDLAVSANVYDADGNVTTACAPRQASENAGAAPAGCTDTSTGYLTHTFYDVADRPIETDTYRTTMSAAQVATSGYDADGNLTSATDANTHTTTATYDLDDRQVTQTVPRAAGVSYTTTTIYDPVGDTVAVIAPGVSGDNSGSGGSGTNVRITGYTFDADHRTLDTVTGLQVASATPTGMAYNNPALTAALSGDLATGTANTRSRSVYDADGNTIATYTPRAFTASIPTGAFSSVYMQRTTYNGDDQPTATFEARSDPNNTDPNAAALTGNEAAQCSSAGPSAAPTYPSSTRICETDAAYDADGNLKTETLPTQTSTTASARVETGTYTADDLLASLATPNPTGSGTATVSTGYDADGEPTTRTDALGLTTTTSYYPNETVEQVVEPGTGSGHSHVTTYGYDANGDQTSQATPRTTYTPGTGAVAGTETDTSTASYTADGLLAQEATPGSTTTSLPSTSDKNVTAYTYDAAGNATSVTSPSAYNNAHPISGVPADSDNSTSAPTTNDYTYDNLLASTSEPVASNGSTFRQTVNTYDPAGRMTAQATNLTGPNSTNSPGDNTTATLITAGGSLGYSWAPNGQQTTRTGRGGADSISSTYTADGDLLTAVDADNSSATVTATYYDDDLLRSVVDPVNYNGSPITGATTYSYDGADNETARNFTGVTTQYYTDNNAGLPTSASGTAAFSWTYNAAGQPLTQTNPNNTTQAWSYNTASGTAQDDTLAATKLTATSGTVLSSDSYTYDENDNLLSDAYYGTAAAGGTTVPSGTPLASRYTYDSDGRLSSWTHPTLNAGTASSTTYTVGYDHDSNRLTYGNRTATYNADNSGATDSGDSANGTPAATYSYDADGRMTTDGTTSYTYDSFDRLTCQVVTAAAANCAQSTPGTGTTAYSYDGLDRQVTRTVNNGSSSTSGLMFYDALSAKLAGERTYNDPATADVQWTNEYYYDGNGSTIGFTHYSGGASPTNVLSSDGHGNITAETGPATGSATPAVNCTVRYDPYGTTLSLNTQTADSSACSTGTSTNDVLYESARRDQSSGSYELGSRTYNPTHGTYNQADTAATPGDTDNPSTGTDPLTANTYSYVNGNPLNYEDPTGHSPIGGGYGATSQTIALCVAGNPDAGAGCQPHDYVNYSNAGRSTVDALSNVADPVEQWLDQFTANLGAGIQDPMGPAAPPVPPVHHDPLPCKGTSCDVGPYVAFVLGLLVPGGEDEVLGALGDLADEADSAGTAAKIVSEGRATATATETSTDTASAGGEATRTSDVRSDPSTHPSTGGSSTPSDVSDAPSAPAAEAGGGGGQVITDTNAVFNRPLVESSLNAGETPVMTRTTSAELSNLVARGPLKMPGFARELGQIDDVMDVNTRINIRGLLEGIKPGQPGLFGDGSIGATALNTGLPVITSDKNFAAVLQQFGVESRTP
jgi:RHS repeat-associated protein